jgi:hypothetical protein
MDAELAGDREAMLASERESCSGSRPEQKEKRIGLAEAHSWAHLAFGQVGLELATTQSRCLDYWERSKARVITGRTMLLILLFLVACIFYVS